MIIFYQNILFKQNIRTLSITKVALICFHFSGACINHTFVGKEFEC